VLGEKQRGFREKEQDGLNELITNTSEATSQPSSAENNGTATERLRNLQDL